MSIYQRILNTPHARQIQKFYADSGLLEIKTYCSAWIEEQLLKHINETATNPQRSVVFYQDLKNTIEYDMYNNQLKLKLDTLEPQHVFNVLLTGLKAEYRFLEEQMQSSNIPVENGPFYNVHIQLMEVDVKVDQIRSDQDCLLARGHELSSNAMFLQECRNECLRIFENLAIALQQYEMVQKIIIDEKIKEWQRAQALAGNGGPLPDNLKSIQLCIEKLLQIMSKLFLACDILLKMSNVSNLTEEEVTNLRRMSQRLTMIREHIIVSSFIVEKQPPQVMKTNTRFAATVRWLIGSEFCNDYTTNTQVNCYILSEQQAQKFVKQPSNYGETSAGNPGTSGEIQHNSCTLEYNQQSNLCQGQFRNMQLKKIKRAEKKGTESVMDEKFTLLFKTTVQRESYSIVAWTLSLPVVVIVHGNQEPQSWATVTWDNAFSEIGRHPFLVPEQVGWELLKSALNTKFASATGRPLTEENLNYLYEKIFQIEITSDCKGYVTWNQFCKEPLQHRSFTFWEWFYAIIKVTKDQLAMAWKEGRIVGFINKNKVSDVLGTHPVGTFLLRFSDSEIGGITVNYKSKNGADHLVMLQPWTAKDLTVRSLSLRIRDLSQLKYLYQGPYDVLLPVDDAFPSDQTEPQVTTGYVTTTVQTVVASSNAARADVQGMPLIQPCLQSPEMEMDMPMQSDDQFELGDPSFFYGQY